MSTWEDIEVGDIVKCIRFHGSTGATLMAHGSGRTYKVIRIEQISKDKRFWILHLESDVGIAPASHMERFELISKAVYYMSPPDMDLDEIHAAQALAGKCS